MDATTGSKATGAIRETDNNIMLTHSILILGEGQMHEAIRATIAAIISVATISEDKVVDNEETVDL